MKKYFKSKYFKSKKGFSLMELLCAILILAIVVSATATGLAVSYTSITTGSVKNKASSLCQEYCDILMTYIEIKKSTDPCSGITLDGTNNELFLGSTGGSSNEYMLNGPVHGNFKDDIRDSWDAFSDASLADFDSYITQYKASKINTHVKKKNRVYYTVENVGKYSYEDKSVSPSVTVEYINYKVTVYIDYTDTNTMHCSGIVSKPKIAP